MRRVHQVSAQLSTHLFLKQDGRYVSAPETPELAEVQRNGWRPLILHAITCEGTLLRSTRLVPLDEPRALEDVVCEQWREDEWIKGPPDCVQVGADLAAAAPGFLRFLEGAGIEVVVRSDKSYAANKRAANADWYSNLPWRPKGPVTVAAMNAEARERNVMGSFTSSKALHELREAWKLLDCRPPIEPRANGLDWTPGDFLAAGFGNSVIKAPKRASSSPRPVLPDDHPLATAPFAGILASWPESLTVVARRVGVTEPQLRAFINGRGSLYRDSAYALAELLQLRLRDCGDEIYYQPTAPYLFLPKTPSSAGRSCDDASDTDNDFYGFVEPIDARSAPPCHLFVFQRCGGWPSFILVPKEAPGAPPGPKWTRALRCGPESFLIPTLEFARLWTAIERARGDAENRRVILFEAVRGHRRLWERMESEIDSYSPTGWMRQTAAHFADYGYLTPGRLAPDRPKTMWA